MRVVGIIPARYGSTRFPGKPLADIGGRPMVWHVWQRATRALPRDAVFVATDDRRIWARCRELSIPVIMTRSDHPTGTDRVAEAADNLDADLVVNIQGDEPMISETAILTIVEVAKDWDFAAINACAPAAKDEVASENVVKVAVGRDLRALFFSRAPIPNGAPQYIKQLGLYAITRDGLKRFSSLKPGPVEAAERVEMMRLLEAGERVQMVRVSNRGSMAVDTPADLDRVRAALC
jgi:3-deoxy-manno-octulosonate cytidylyltransferase (CMP-KDO synthetase)